MDRLYVLIRQVLALAWRQRWLIVATSWGLCIIGWVGVYTIPNAYESGARLYVDTDAILTPLLRGLAIDNAMANQIELLQRTLLSRPNLEKLIGTTDLNIEVADPQRKEQLILQLSRDIKLISEGHNLFWITYRNNNPQRARDVVAGLVNLFMEKAASSSRADMSNAQKFLNQEISSYEVKLRAAEQRRVDFRRKYMDILPLENNSGGSRLDSARGAVGDLELQLREANAHRAAFQDELTKTLPMVTASSQDPAAAAEARLTEMRSRFTEDHPDVVMTRKLIATLRAAPKGSEPAANSGEANRSTVPNPVYAQVKLRLIEAEGTISSVQARLENARNGLSRMEELARAAPQVEAEYQNLNRDYNVLQKNYEELLARRESSNLTAAADTGADKVRLRIIDPPQVATVPVAPNRLMLLSVVLLAALGAGAALPILLSQTDQSIKELGGLRDFGRPVLGGVSLVPTLTRPMRLYSQGVTVGASIVLLLVVYAGLASGKIPHHTIVF
jgi:polysaccharide chain length determinant protein (PEP-CTERM system associated)